MKKKKKSEECIFCISHRFFLFHLNARCSLFHRKKNFHNLARPRCIATVAQIQLDFMKVVNLGISTAENKTKSIPFAENDLLQSSKGAKKKRFRESFCDSRNVQRQTKKTKLAYSFCTES